MSIVNRFVSGFELNSLTAGDEWETVSNTNTPLSIAAAAARTGAYGLRYVAGSSMGWLQQQTRGAVAANQTMFARFAIRWNEVPSATAIVAELHKNDGASNTLLISMTTGNALRLYTGNTSVLTLRGSDTPAINDGAWHYVEFGGVYDTDRVYMRMDGIEYANEIAGGVVTINFFRIGGGTQPAAATQLTWGTTPTTGEWDIDDVIVCDGTDSSDTIPSGDWPGVGGLICLRPNAAGESNPSTGDWSGIDETPPSSADVITCATTVVGYFDMDPTPSAVGSGDSIAFVAVGGDVSVASASTANYQFRIESQSGGTKVSGTSVALASTTYQILDDTAGSKYYGLVQLTDPQGGGAWTKALVDTMQCGFARVSGTPDVRCSAMWAYVFGVFTGPPKSLMPTRSQWHVWNRRLP